MKKYYDIRSTDKQLEQKVCKSRNKETFLQVCNWLQEKHPIYGFSVIKNHVFWMEGKTGVSLER